MSVSIKHARTGLGLQRTLLLSTAVFLGWPILACGDSGGGGGFTAVTTPTVPAGATNATPPATTPGDATTPTTDVSVTTAPNATGPTPSTTDMSVPTPPTATDAMMGGGGATATDPVTPTLTPTDPVTNPLAPTPSSGCGAALPLDVSGAPQAMGRYSEYTMTPQQVFDACTLSPPASCDAALGLTTPVVDAFGVTRSDRQYYVRLPNNYDPTRMYQLVYVAMGCFDRAVADLNAPGMEKTYHFYDVAGDDVIIVGLQYVGTPTNLCYDDMILASRDFPYIEATHQQVESQFCFDTNRVAFTGYSSGGWLSNSVGCLFSGPDGFVRTIGVYTGGEPEYLTSNQWQCADQPTAAIFVHDELDEENRISGNITARNRALRANGCVGAENEQSNIVPTLPTAPYALEFGAQLLGATPAANQCVSYTGCPAEYPVVWCVTQNVQHSSSNDSFVVPAFWTFMSGL